MRKLTKTLMKRTGDEFDSTRFPTEKELKSFNPSLGRCCTADDVRPDLAGSAHMPWNTSVAEVFAEEFIERNVYPCRDEVEIKKIFFSISPIYAHAAYCGRSRHNREERKRRVSAPSMLRRPY